MYHFKTVVKKSEVHGVGVFTEEFIPKGAVTWTFNPLFDKIIMPDDYEKLPSHIREFVHIYGCFDPEGYWYLDGGSGLFTNHSETPNCIDKPADDKWPRGLQAARDIQIGEEILEDYRGYDGRFDLKGI
jgi:SET domain-containing protein